MNPGTHALKNLNYEITMQDCEIRGEGMLD
jgi:hypothetical protein